MSDTRPDLRQCLGKTGSRIVGSDGLKFSPFQIDRWPVLRQFWSCSGRSGRRRLKMGSTAIFDHCGAARLNPRFLVNYHLLVHVGVGHDDDIDA